jgi:hypothetical protein
MKPRRSRVLGLVVAVGLLVLTGFPSATAQTSEPVSWTALGPTEKPIVRLFAPTSGALFAATEHELFRSHDGGLTWVTVERPPQTNIVTVSPLDHHLLYAAGSGGIQRSMDGGSSWEHVSDEGGNWRLIEVSPADPNVLYGVASTESRDASVSTVQTQLRLSRDAGVSWQVMRTYDERRVSGSYPCVYTVWQLQPHQISSGRLATIEGCTVRADPTSRMSTDEGRTTSLFPEVDMLSWSANAAVGGQGVRPDRWYVSLHRSNVVYTRVRHSQVQRTDDNGSSWTTVYEDTWGDRYKDPPKPVEFVSTLTYNSQRPDDLFAVFERYEPNSDRYKEMEPVGFTVRTSRDAGVSWSEIGARELPAVSRLAVGVDGRHLYAATRKGVYRIELPVSARTSPMVGPPATPQA